MTRNQNLAAVVFLIVVGGATVVWLQLRGGSETPRATPATQSTAAAPAAPPSAAAPASAAASSRVRRLADPSGRTEILRQVREVHAKRTAVGGNSSSESTPAPALPAPPAIEKEYIRASVRELIPLLVECYEAVLEKDPKLAGSIIVNFTIEGEPGVGGVIGESAIDPEASTLTDPTMRECVQETMYGIEIEPPAGGGVVKVRYPFEFRPSE